MEAAEETRGIQKQMCQVIAGFVGIGFPLNESRVFLRR